MFTFLFFITAQIVSQVCLGCICEVSSGCNTTIGCSEAVCGPFAITWGYWSDAGKPTLNSEPLSDNGGLHSLIQNTLDNIEAHKNNFSFFFILYSHASFRIF